MSGKGADIFFGSYFDMDFENLADKGALVDLYELIDADEDIGREDFIQSILNAMEYKGKLYAVPHDFSLYTIVGKKSLLEKYDKWDYDSNMAECSFDSEQFIKLLELAKNSGTEYDISADAGELLTNEKVLLYESQIGNWEDIQLLPYYFGDDIAYVGYPSNAESGTVLRCYYQWAISGQTQYRDGAWQFIKSLFDHENQRTGVYFPVIRADFEDMISDAMVFNENFSYGLANGVSVGIHAMTEAEADELRELVDNATLIISAHDDMDNIINEEAQYYFAGTRSAEEEYIVYD